jgi:MFS family permease
MASPKRAASGTWRAVPVLGITQILSWGAIFYTPVLMVPLIAAERGWTLSFAMGGFSLGLLAAGLASPRVGQLIDRHGGHCVMPVGALLGAAGLVGVVHASDLVLYIAAWAVLGLAMAASLYDPAFASLGRIFGREARRSITLLTFIGGFASTVSWPATHFLIERLGWRGTYLTYAALLALLAAPLLAFALPRTRAETVLPAENLTARPFLPARGLTFVLVATAFAAYAFVPSALSAHLIAIFDRLGLQLGTAVAIGALFGPSQVFARLTEFLFAKNVHPLAIARFALGMLVVAFALLAAFGISIAAAAAFMILFGMLTIARGTVPLSLFGATGYGGIIGRIAGPFLLIQAAAPLVVAFAAERISDAYALALVAAFAVAALACFLAIRRPR